MAAIELTDCTVTNTQVGAFRLVKLVTPTTTDDADTIDITGLNYKNGQFNFQSGATDDTAIDTTDYGTGITIMGSTDNEARTIICIGE